MTQKPNKVIIVSLLPPFRLTLSRYVFDIVAFFYLYFNFPGHYPSKDISDTLTMPKLIQVKSLYTITLKQVNSILCELAQNDQCSPDTVTWIKSHLHGNIREQLLAQFNQWHLPYNFNYMKCVIDCSLKSIVLNECLSNRAMTGLNYIEFMKYLHEQNICNLCNFSLHFKVSMFLTAHQPNSLY